MPDLVADILTRAERLRPPSHRNPHAFHDDKGELIGALHELAHRVRTSR